MQETQPNTAKRLWVTERVIFSIGYREKKRHDVASGGSISAKPAGAARCGAASAKRWTETNYFHSTLTIS
jgi:hypothetical protein